MRSFAVALTLAGAAQAMISRVACPKMIQPGDTFNITFETVNSQSPVQDVGGAVGFWPGSGIDDYLGTWFASFFFGPGESNVSPNDVYQAVTVPETAPLGSFTLTVSTLSILGASGMPLLKSYKLPVEFGSETSRELVESIIVD